jgi:hypothetical protein
MIAVDAFGGHQAFGGGGGGCRVDAGRVAAHRNDGAQRELARVVDLLDRHFSAGAMAG